MKNNTLKNLIRTTILAAAISASQLFAGESAQLKVKPIKQEPEQCIPTSASMMLALNGWNYPPRQIKLATKNKPYYGPNTPFNDFTMTSLGDLKKGLSTLGQNWRTGAYKGDAAGLTKGMQDIKASLKNGKPVLLGVGLNAVVVCGFDDDNKLFTIADPGTGSIGTYAYSSMESIWNYRAQRVNLRGALFMN